jgi:hypothetical protein
LGGSFTGIIDDETGKSTKMDNRPKKLLDQAHEIMRVRHYPIRTEGAYLSWMSRFILFHKQRHPRDVGSPEMEAFFEPSRCGFDGLLIDPESYGQWTTSPLRSGFGKQLTDAQNRTLMGLR